jgi:Protein of unknown function (DUF1579)
MMHAEPQKQHEWLKKLVGEWTLETEAPAEPGKAPETLTGVETVRTLGDVWVVFEGRGQMPGGGEGLTLMTLGYDPQKGRFVGTWQGSMMSNLWVYDGELDAAERVLSLHSEGPSFSGGAALDKYRDEIELVSGDHRILRSHVLGANGEWNHFMTAHYRRKQ